MLKQLEAENRLATPEEQKVLARYVGWGGLAPVFNNYGRGSEEWANERKELQELLTPEEYRAARASMNNAHYTSPEVIKGVWDIVDRLGFKRGRVLEEYMSEHQNDHSAVSLWNYFRSVIDWVQATFSEETKRNERIAMGYFL